MSRQISPIFDRADTAFLDDPYPTWTRLRDTDPLHRSDSGTIVVSRHADVTTLLRHPSVGRDIPQRLVRRAAGDGPTTAAFFASLLNLEDEDHTRVRKLLLRRFAHRAVLELRERIAELVDEELPAAGGRIDLVDAVAGPLPLRVMFEVLGLPRADEATVSSRIADLIGASQLFPGSEEMRRSDEANAFFRSYVAQAITRDDAAPGLLRELGEAVDDGRSDDLEVASNVALLLFAGHETTTNGISNGVHTLLSHPGAMATLRARPQLIPTAVDELLRIDSPVQMTMRWTSGRVELPSGEIEPRRFVEVSLAAANTDPRAFDGADELRLDRDDNPHVAFAAGRHLCLGAALARLTIGVVLEMLLQRYSLIELDGEPVRLRSLWNRGLTSLPLRLEP